MATNKTLIDGVQPSTTGAVDSYTSPANGAGTRIVAFTASNLTGVETYSVFIGDAATAENEIIPSRAIGENSADTPLELINHLIPAGKKLFVQVSSANTISFRVTGIEF